MKWFLGITATFVWIAILLLSFVVIKSSDMMEVNVSIKPKSNKKSIPIEATDQVEHKQPEDTIEEILDAGDRVIAQAITQEEIPERPAVKKRPKITQEEIPERPKKYTPIPNKNIPNPKIKIKDKDEELPTPPYNAERTIQTMIENKLVSILVKINLAACKTCTRDDKRVILQLKMMKAFFDGKPQLAQKYSEDLEKYIITNRK